MKMLLLKCYIILIFVCCISLGNLSKKYSISLNNQNKIFFKNKLIGSNIPGLNAGIGRGYDIVYGKTKGPIIQWHYDQKNTWSFPLDGNVYSFPDEVWVTNTPDSIYTSSNYIFRNLTDFIHQEFSWHSMTFGIPGIFYFGGTKETKIVDKFFRDRNSTVYLIDRQFDMYSISCWPYSILNGQSQSVFSQMVDKLPTNYDDVAYNNFIKVFGTHYIPETAFGGHFYYLISVNNTLYERYSSKWVYEQVGFEVNLYDVGFGFTKVSNNSQTKVDREFIKNSEILVQWVGGIAGEEGENSNNIKNFKTWYESVIKSPAMLNPHYVSITDLISDPIKKTNLENAIKKYLNTPPKVQKVQSGNTIPGLQSGIGRGFDAVHERIKAPVVFWTFNSQNSWNDPFNNNAAENYPDQVYLTEISQSVDDKKINLFRSWESYYQHKTSSFGVDISLGYDGVKVDFGFQRSKSEINAMTKNHTRDLGIGTIIIAHFQLDLWPITNIPSPIQTMINQLPDQFDSKKYGDFVNIFGTHYITSAQFGGKINVTTAFDLTLYNHFSSEWVANQVKLSISWNEFKAGINWNSNTSKQAIDGNFLEHSENYTECDGGFPEVFQAKGFTAWSETLGTNPGIIFDRVTLVPITELLNNYPTDRKSVV